MNQHELWPRWATELPAAGEPVRPYCRGEVLVRLLSFTSRISSNCPRVLAGLASLYSTADPGARRRVGTRAVRCSVVECRVHGHSRYRVVAPDGGESLHEDPSDAMACLENLVTTAAAASLARHLLVHAGAVVAESGAIVLPGPSGAGKSTLVAALCHAGFRYLSDEIAVLALRSKRVLPFLKAICLKNGASGALAEHFGVSPSLLTANRSEGETVNYWQPPNPCQPGESLEVRYILLPRYRSGAPTALVPVSRAQAVFEMAQHSLNFPRHGGKGLETLAQVVERAECFSLTFDDLGDAVAAVSGLVGHRGWDPTGLVPLDAQQTPALEPGWLRSADVFRDALEGTLTPSGGG